MLFFTRGILTSLHRSLGGKEYSLKGALVGSLNGSILKAWVPSTYNTEDFIYTPLLPAWSYDCKMTKLPHRSCQMGGTTCSHK